VLVRYIVAIVSVVVIIGALVAVKGAQIGKLTGFGKQMEKNGPPPETVGTWVAETQTWEATIPAVGSVASGKGVAISTDTPGTVVRISFESGQTVKQGQVLVELDSSVERAQLATAIARRDLATSNVGRTRALAGKGVLSQAQIDADESSARTSVTEVESIQAQIAKKTIRAPFNGKLGIRAVNLGQYLNPSTPVTTLETVESMHVDFTLPQQRLGELAVGMPVRISATGTGGAEDSASVVNATIGAIDPSIDPVTRSIKLRADVPEGQGRALRNGMFVNVAVILPQKTTLVAVPEPAIIHAPYGDSVFIVEDKKADAPGLRETPDGKPIKVARQQFVKIGQRRGDFVSILDGVKAPQEVVASGGFKLRNNSPIVVDNSKALKPSLDPRPENR
jgi:membrane fusion protein (multidrug efflux system)